MVVGCLLYVYCFLVETICILRVDGCGPVSRADIISTRAITLLCPGSWKLDINKVTYNSGLLRTNAVLM